MSANTYTATLFDCPVSSADKDEATEIFCREIERILGGESAVAEAYSAYQAAFEQYGQTPLPSGASNSEHAAVERWADAERKATRAAFAGWRSMPDGAHFEIDLDSVGA